MSTRRQRFLAHPVTVKMSVDGGNRWVRFGASAMQGWRTRMEDTLVANPSLSCEARGDPALARHDVGIFAVFDGHGGRGVAEFCEQHLPIELWWNERFRAGALGHALQVNLSSH